MLNNNGAFIRPLFYYRSKKNNDKNRNAIQRGKRSNVELKRATRGRLPMVGKWCYNEIQAQKNTGGV